MMSFPRLQKHAPLTRDVGSQARAAKSNIASRRLSFADKDNFLESLGRIFTYC